MKLFFNNFSKKILLRNFDKICNLLKKLVFKRFFNKKYKVKIKRLFQINIYNYKNLTKVKKLYIITL